MAIFQQAARNFSNNVINDKQSMTLDCQQSLMTLTPTSPQSTSFQAYCQSLYLFAATFSDSILLNFATLLAWCILLPFYPTAAQDIPP